MKLCKDCQHFEARVTALSRTDRFVCTSPSLGTSPVDGINEVIPCILSRSLSTLCGSTGRWYMETDRATKDFAARST
jgi:hypothetical protein